MLEKTEKNLQKPSLKSRLSALRNAAIAEYRINPRPQKLLRTFCRAVDNLMVEMWKESGIAREHTLAAVGGYGRGELFPYSDIDLLILLTKDPDDELRKKLETLIQRFWTMGITIGHSVRTVDECLEESARDITIQTCLLEARYITGSRKLFSELQKKFRERMDPQAFFIAKMLEAHQRHIKMGGTPYSLEPNCKENPGGLRDLQMILWASKAAGLGSSWNELAKRSLITPAEAQQLRKKERAFKDIRIRLHIQANRCEDRLLFDLQMPVAETFRFVKKGKLLDRRSASECMMQRYYRAAHTVTQLNLILLQNMELRLFPKNTRSDPINPRFCKFNRLIAMANSDVFIKYPASMFEVFCLLGQHKELRNMSARTLRALWHARVHIDRNFRKDPQCQANFLNIFKAPHFSSRILQQMNDLGLLSRYLPNFGKITGQMQHDLFHQYTVDQHTLTVISNLHRFTLTEYAHEYPFCSQLMAAFDKPWLLYIAALFHDIAKGRGGDHSILGAADARRFCKQHKLDPEDAEMIEFLVREHLLMSTVAQKRDMSDPEVIRYFADTVKNKRRMSALFLLTVADIRGTNPEIWNAWKGKLLEDLYRMTMRVLGGEELSTAHELKHRQQEALTTLLLYGIPPKDHAEFWKQLDIVYFLRHDASDVAWQTRMLYWRANTTEPVVKCRLSPIGEGLQVTVYMQDVQDVFARICSYFDRKNFRIWDAKVHTTTRRYVLDTFLITHPDFEKSYRDIISLVEHELTEVLKAGGPLPPPATPYYSRITRSYPLTPTLDLQPDSSGTAFVLSVTASDRTGLLYSVARVFSKYKVNLQMAKIMTLGDRIEDVFLIDSDMFRLASVQIQFETDMLAALKIN